MKKLLLLICLGISTGSVAQPGNWRIGVQVGRAYTVWDYRITPTPPARRLEFSLKTATVWQITADRSLNPYVSVRLGYGRIRMPYELSTFKELRNAAGQLRSVSGTSLSGGTAFSTGIIGVTVNSPSYWRVIFTGGLDMNIRFANSNRKRFIFGGRGTSTLIMPPDTFRTEEAYMFESGQLPAVSLSLAPRIGIDIRMLNRTFLTLQTQYNVGLGDIVKGSADDILLDMQLHSGGYESKGSGWGWQVGLRQTVGRLKAMNRSAYTPYNKPQFSTPWNEDEYQHTFAKGTWLVGARGTYGRGLLLSKHADIQVRGGYFVLDQLVLGLNGEWFHEWNNDSFFSNKMNHWLAGPLVRYHLTSTRLSPFLEASYQMGLYNYQSKVGGFGPKGRRIWVSSWTLTPGLSARISQRLRADLVYNWQHIAYQASSRSFQDRRLQVGLNYLITRQLGITQP